jgi:hypothetical protein
MFRKFRTAVLTIVITAAAPFALEAQTTDYIKTSGFYYWGVGSGSNYSSARRNALENLTESISVHIKSEFEQVVKETNDDLDIYVKSVVTTYSSAVISHYEEQVIKEVPGSVEVFVYITREQMAEVFKQREQMIGDFIMMAGRAMQELRVADALRYYYWALVMARSHPDNTRLRHNFGGSISEPVMMGLSDRINRIFSFISFELTTVIESENLSQKQLHLTIKFENKPVQDVDYNYWVGDGYSGLVSARSGMGLAILDGEAAREFSSLRLRVEYQYSNKAHLEPEVQMMLENVEIPYFARAEYKVDISGQAGTVTRLPGPAEFQVVGRGKAGYEVYRDAVSKVVNAIEKGTHDDVRSRFTPGGFDMYSKLIASGKVTVLEPQFDTLRIMKIGNETMVRSVPMHFSYHNNRERFIESVVFTFDNEYLINSLSFSLGDIAINDILSKPTGFGSEEDKFFLIRFMEDYKTAYSLKRLDYLEAIFDEKALIIVGNIARRTNEPVEKVSGMYANLTNQQVEYIIVSKAEFIKRLSRVFDRNEFINLRFEDNQVRKIERDDKIYGIQIAQHYYSSTYADKGYLFLMIDLNDTLQPKVYVRSWQPEKNTDGSIFGLEDFRF